jgi:hypothetical protein
VFVFGFIENRPVPVLLRLKPELRLADDGLLLVPVVRHMAFEFSLSSLALASVLFFAIVKN